MDELQQEPTVQRRKIRVLEEIGDLRHDDPVVVRVMGLLEKEAHDFGLEQKVRLVAEKATLDDVLLAIWTHIALADIGHELSVAQRDYLAKVCFTAAGLRMQ